MTAVTPGQAADTWRALVDDILVTFRGAHHGDSQRSDVGKRTFEKWSGRVDALRQADAAQQPQPAPELAEEQVAEFRQSAEWERFGTANRAIQAATAPAVPAPELAALADRLRSAAERWGRHAEEQARAAERALADPVPVRRLVVREGHLQRARVYQALAAEISELIGEAK